MYKVRLIVPALGRNPDFNRRLPVGPDNPLDLLRPVGFEMTGPDCWMHCMPDAASGIIRAEPADDITQAKVDQALANRAKGLEDRARRKSAELTELAKQRGKRRGRGGQKDSPATK